MGDNNNFVFLSYLFICFLSVVSASSFESTYFIYSDEIVDSDERGDVYMSHYLFDFLWLVFAVGVVFFLYRVFFASIFERKRKRNLLKRRKRLRKRK